MYLYVCFDVEDIVHPDSDDIALDIASMLADEGIVACMYVVGEKARLWERRGRRDVIAAVNQHDVGLHTDHHSIHPTVSEYLADKGWLDGVAEAIRQEGPGVSDLARIFGRYPSSWATSGSSWGPQIPAATHLLGLGSQIYSHVRSGETGACWYGGQLCFADFFNFSRGEDTYSDDSVFEAALPTLLEQVSNAQRSGLSCMGLFGAHPTRLRYKLFWDRINYNRGQNTPPSEYRFAPRRTDEEYQTSLRNLRRLILAVRDLSGIEIAGTQAINNRFDLENAPVAWYQILQLAQSVAGSDSISAADPLASPAQTLDLLARATLRQVDGAPPTYLALRTVLGPIDMPPILDKPLAITPEEGLALCRALVEHIAQKGYLPTSLPAGKTEVGPGALLRGLAAALLSTDGRSRPGQMTLLPGAETPAVAERLAQEGIYEQLPSWTPHRPDLRLDLLALHMQLQSWSLKPAQLAD